MKCLTCNFEGAFGTITISSSDGYASAIGRMPNPKRKNEFNHLGSIDIFVCPNCGSLHSTMRGTIAMENRKN